MSWTDVENDPKFADLSATDRTRAKEMYFDKKVAEDPKYKALAPADQKRAKDTFLFHSGTTNIAGQKLYPAAPEIGKAAAAKQTGQEMLGDAGIYLSKNALAIIGGAEGAVEGAALGAATTGPLAPAGAAIGAVLGAYTGGVAGQSVTETIEAGVKALAPGLGPQKSAGEVLQSVRDAGNAMGEAEVGGRGLGNALGLAGKALLPPLEKRAPQLVRAVKAAMTSNILPSMAQVTQSRFVAGMEEVVSKMPFIGDNIMAMRAEQDAGYDAMRREVLAKAGPEFKPEVLGTQSAGKVNEYLDMKLAERQKAVLVERAKIMARHGESVSTRELGQQLDALRLARDRVAKQTNTKFYETIDQAIPAAQNQVADTNLRKVADQKFKELEPTPSAFDGQLKTLLNHLKNGPGGKVIDESGAPVLYAPDGSVASKVIGERKTYTFQEMSNIVGDLTSRIKEESLKANPFGKAVGGSTTRTGLHLMEVKDAALKDLAGFSETLPEDVKALKGVADANYRSYKGKFGNDDMAAMSRAAKDNPEDVYKLFVKPNNVSSIQRLKAVVGVKTAEETEAELKDMVLKVDAAEEQNPEGRLAEQMKDQYDAMLADARRAHGPEVFAGMKARVDAHLADVLDEGYADGNELGRQKLRSDGGVEPDATKRAASTSASSAAAAAGEPPVDGMVPFRRKFVENLITGPDGKMLSGPEILRNMNHIGYETMAEILTPAQLQDLHKSATTLQLPAFVEGQVEKKLRALITMNGGRGPEDVVQRVINGDSVTVKALRKIMGPKGMEPYKRAVLEDAIGKPVAVAPLGGSAVVPTVNKISKTLRAYGRTIDYLFSPDEVAEIERVEQVRSLMESQANLNANRSGTASSGAAKLIEYGSLGLVIKNPVIGVPVVIGQELLSRFYVSKTGRELLLKGMSDGAADNIVLYSRLAAFVLNAKRGELNDEFAKLGPVAAPAKPLPQRIAPETRAQAYDSRISGAPADQPQTLQGRGLLGLP